MLVGKNIIGSEIMKPEEKYQELFDSVEKKAEAFDKIAEVYYMNNFGSMSKSDFDTLMFSIYIDEILKNSEDDFNSYSDYTLSKYLGITQSRVSSLKVKKELKYHYDGFDWKKSLKRISENVRFENGKIKLNVRDKNLYYELKNVIEENGGFVDIQLNSTLLMVSPEYFVDLMLYIEEDQCREQIREQLRTELKKHSIDAEYLENQSFSEILKEQTVNLGMKALCEIIGNCIPVAGPVVSIIMENVWNEMSKHIR